MTMKFIDLFAGIGGFRIGMERAGFECVFSSEIDENACEVYEANFGDNPWNDITDFDVNRIPDFDILCAGFPCQAFSISGKQQGFYDETRGTLFFEICRVLDAKKPRAFILENVKNLSTHDKGRTLSVMLDALAKLGYTVNYKVLNAKDFGVPQNRERVVIVGNRDGLFFDFEKVLNNKVSSMEEFLDEDGDFEYLEPSEYTILDDERIKTQSVSGLKFVGYRNKKMRTVGVREGTEHLSRVHKQPNRIYSTDGVHPTIPSQETTGRFFIYNNGVVRKLTIEECYRFMGFPDDFKRVGRKAQQYLRIGNSICINMVEQVALQLKHLLEGELDMQEEVNPRQFLEARFTEVQALTIEQLTEKYPLDDTQLKNVLNIVQKEATLKAVYTVLFSSLTYKILNPKQDVRFHQVELTDGYSGRTFDTKFVTPFLKDKRMRGAMKESGWLTRSLEQKHPYRMDFPGAINNKVVKQSFLEILNDLEVNKEAPQNYLMNILKRSIIEKEKQNVVLVNPVIREDKLDIDDIMDILSKHFYYGYTSRGVSILPVVAIYSIYESLIKEMNRYSGKYLEPLGSHYSSDRSSGSAGDIVIRNSDDDSHYEVVEVKFEIPIDIMILEDAYNKIKPTSIQRYYILSTHTPTSDDVKLYNSRIKEIKEEHGCQMIINGLMRTLRYYLRLIENTDEFVNNYVKNIKRHPEINYEHQVSWNKLIV